MFPVGGSRFQLYPLRGAVYRDRRVCQQKDAEFRKITFVLRKKYLNSRKLPRNGGVLYTVMNAYLGGTRALNATGIAIPSGLIITRAVRILLLTTQPGDILFRLARWEAGIPSVFKL